MRDCTRIIMLIVLLAALPFSILNAQEIGISWEFNEEGNSEGWAVYNSLADLDVSAGKLKANVTGTNAAFAGPAFHLVASDYGFIILRMRFTGNTPTARIRWKYSESTSIGRFDFHVTGDGEFHEYQIPVYTKSRWIGQITEFIDFTIKAEVGSIIEIDYIRALSLGPRLEILSFKPYRTILKRGHSIPIEAVVQNTGDKSSDSTFVSFQLPDEFDLLDGLRDFQIGTLETQQKDTLRWTVISNDTGNYELHLKTTNPEFEATLETTITDKFWQLDQFFLTAWSSPPPTNEGYEYFANANFGLLITVPFEESAVDLVAQYDMRCLLRILDGVIDETEYLRAPDFNTPEDLTEEDLSKLDDLIERFKDNPTVIGYYITDEPQPPAYPNLAKVVSYLRKKDPERLAYINLIAHTGGGYVEDFLDIVKPELISYDFYGFLLNEDRVDYFVRLEYFRKISLEYDVPFMNVIQAVGREEKVLWRIPNEGEERWLVYSTLAYGAKGLMYFHWTADGWGILESPKRDEIYANIKELNREINLLGPVLLELESKAVYHTLTQPVGTIELAEDALVKSVSENANLVVGVFKDENEKDFIMLMNKDYTDSVTATITLNRPVDKLEFFDVNTEDWQDITFQNTAEGALFECAFRPGGGKLFSVGDVTAVKDVRNTSVPVTCKLAQNYPNPFNPVTHIQYQLADKEKVVLSIYDVLGREVEKLVDEKQKSGLYDITWEAGEFPNGLYFYRLKAGTFVQTRKMMLLK